MPSASAQAEKECPLCLEQLDLYEKDFFPCKCGYQVCQFCWNRIKEDENNLCPACRHPYSDVPVDLKPVSCDEWKKILSDKKKRDLKEKPKTSESRKHLASYRVVQKNLVLIHGVPIKLADPETLKKFEYFGQFGKIHKIIVGSRLNGSQSQNQSAGVYVTYYKEEDAVRAILNLNQRQLEGRTLKASLGTTKYCSLFLQNKPCQKQDCMYLHYVAEAKASFTKEDMAAKKHEEYERKLCDEIAARINSVRTQNSSSPHNEIAAMKNEELVINEKVNENTTIPPRHRKLESKCITKSSEPLKQHLVSDQNLKPKKVKNETKLLHECTVSPLFRVNEDSLFSNDDDSYLRTIKLDRISSEDHINCNVSRGLDNKLKIREQSENQVEYKNVKSDQENVFCFETNDDDLGFDPYTESSKGLEDLVRQEKEQINQQKIYLLQQTNREGWLQNPHILNAVHARMPTPFYSEKEKFDQDTLLESHRSYHYKPTPAYQSVSQIALRKFCLGKGAWMERMSHEKQLLKDGCLPLNVQNVYYNSSLLNKWTQPDLYVGLNSRNTRSQPFVQLQTTSNEIVHSGLRNGWVP